jgi:hypothetical protein
MRLNLGLHARHIYRIRRQKRAILIWIKYFSNLSRNSRKALCSGWDWHQSEGMAKLTTSLNAFFKTRKSAKRLEISPFAGFPNVRLRNSPCRLGSPVQKAAVSDRHSIPSSASASSVGGTSSPNAFAVLRLMTSSRVKCVPASDHLGWGLMGHVAHQDDVNALAASPPRAAISATWH